MVLPEMGREVSLFADIKSLWTIYRLLRKEKPHIVHTHTAKAGAIGRLAAFLAGVPVIIHTFHGHVFHSYFSKWKSSFFIFVERLLAKISDAIIVISEHQFRDITGVYHISSPDKTYTIPLGFNWDAFDQSQDTLDLVNTFHIPRGKKIIAIIGRLVPIKNIKAFIQIAGLIEKAEPGVYHYLIIGDGKLRAELEQYTHESDLTPHITFTGWLPLSAAIYKQFSLVILTSLNEGTPVTLIEALACGIPCLSTDVGGVKDIFKFYDSANLIHSDNPEKAASRAVEILKNNEQPASSVIKNVRYHYSAQRLKDDIKSLYDALLKKEGFYSNA